MCVCVCVCVRKYSRYVVHVSCDKGKFKEMVEPNSSYMQG